MAGSTFGTVFKVTTWGESHGTALGAVIDGCPPGLDLTPEMIQEELERRRPGKGGATSPRNEPDMVQIMSGIFQPEGSAVPKTTGTPISLVILNKDAHSKSYSHLQDVFRPGHGDLTYQKKYGIRDHRGGGRASARETAARVAAGAVAQQLLDRHGMSVQAYTVALGGIKAEQRNFDQIRENRLFCPDNAAAERMEERIREVRSQGDTLGGIVEVRARCKVGLGEPVFDKLDAELARALMSIGAVKGVEIGSGFRTAEMLGSENNDPITPEGFLSNNAGGILAGLSNGEDIIVRVAVKPIPSIHKEQQTVNRANEPVSIKVGGRHDISAIPRIIPVCEAMVRLTLADHLLRQQAILVIE
ncbi:MAG: chorismate synthase [Candidatus Electrothrix sp. GW3-4]|uniref:chorismate synthase n=1 Tax=Candidatus Electrothrix sp. GW3-4 TaxID=3126740 RepID=UPI0030CF9ED7